MIAFLCQYWDYLRGITKTEPKPADFGLDDSMGECLKRHCLIEAARMGLK